MQIVAIKYCEPEYQETINCIKKTGIDVIWVDRNPEGVGSLAEAINRGVKQATADFVWIVTNVTFDDSVPFKLLKNIGKADAIHPTFDSDHKHIREGKGVQEAPFIEFTAAFINRAKWIGLDENCPYWGHDLIHGYEVHKNGGSILVDYTTKVEHVYIRNKSRNHYTDRRKASRLNSNNHTRDYLKTKYGQNWREVIFPKTEKDIVKFYAQVKSHINREASKTICIDLDGVLTDGKVWVSHTGQITKGFHTRDLTAIRELIANGYGVNIVTASSWDGAENYLRKSGAELHVIRNKELIPFDFDIAVGDSAWDIPMLTRAKEMFCPADSAMEIKTLDGMNILQTKGGEGVILELCRILCPKNG